MKIAKGLPLMKWCTEIDGKQLSAEHIVAGLYSSTVPQEGLERLPAVIEV